MLALSVGVREAARQLGLNENRVLQWSKREQWFKPDPHPPKQGDVITVIKPSQALAETLKAHGNDTKLGLSTAAKKAATHAAKMTPVQVLNVSRELKNVTDIAEKVHGWNQSARTTSVFAQNAVVIDDATIDELQARLARLRGEA